MNDGLMATAPAFLSCGPARRIFPTASARATHTAAIWAHYLFGSETNSDTWWATDGGVDTIATAALDDALKAIAMLQLLNSYRGFRNSILLASQEFDKTLQTPIS
jgi:hypothetical protein